MLVEIWLAVCIIINIQTIMVIKLVPFQRSGEQLKLWGELHLLFQNNTLLCLEKVAQHGQTHLQD